MITKFKLFESSSNIFYDKNNNMLKDGDIIDIHQTINGQRKFYIKSLSPLDIRYLYDLNKKYEYDKIELISPGMYGDIEMEIIDDIENYLKTQKATEFNL